jgi:hypothetical protein
MSDVAAGVLKPGGQRRHTRMAVDIDLHPNAHTVFVGQKDFSLSLGYSAGDVENLNREFIAVLEDIRLNVRDDLTLSDADYDYYMKQLRDVGATAYGILPAGLADYIEELEREEPLRGLRLDFSFPTGMDLLWEMVYTGDAVGAVDKDKFWGFRYPIGHLYWGAPVRDYIRLQKGIFASAHDELKCSLEELNQLEESLKMMQDGTPRDFAVFRVEDALADDAVEGENLLTYFNEDDFGCGIVHFACHCVNPPHGIGATKAHLLFTAHKNELSLYLSKIVAHSARGGFRARPLVFLNACESATKLQFLQSLNLPSSFLKFKAGGVIATACTMPDNFASAFASRFYRRLLGKPSNDAPAFIAETILEISRTFLDDFKNPLGLAYSLYAVSNQELQLD